MITVYTSKPKGLLAKFKKAIDEDHIRTWAYDQAGDFTHTAVQWNRRAWFRPYIVPSSALEFGLLGIEGVKMTKDVYGMYHGHLVDMFLRHFDDDFSSICASAHSEAGTDNF